MRVRVRHALIALVAAVALIAGVASVSASVERYAYCPFRASIDYCSFPPLAFKVDGVAKPKALPKREMSPIAVEVRGTVVRSNATHPPALREAIIDLDKNTEIDAASLPACGFRRLAGRSTATVRTACRDAIVGKGMAQIGFATSEGQPVEAPLTLVNGGIAGGLTKLFIHGEIATSPPVPLVATVKIEKARKGRYGVSTQWRIPRILEGSGSLLKFNFELERGYVRARCTDGKLQTNIVKALFRNEAGPQTVTIMKGTVIKSCTPTL